MDTCQLTPSQGEADGVSDGGMTLQALGGVNSPCGWFFVRGHLPSTGGQEHTHTHATIEKNDKVCHQRCEIIDFNFLIY